LSVDKLVGHADTSTMQATVASSFNERQFTMASNAAMFHADKAYAHEQARSVELLAKLELLIAKHAPTTKINWAHVGDLTELNAKLAEAVAFVGGE